MGEQGARPTTRPGCLPLLDDGRRRRHHYDGDLLGADPTGNYARIAADARHAVRMGFSHPARSFRDQVVHQSIHVAKHGSFGVERRAGYRRQERVETRPVRQRGLISKPQ